MENKTELPFKFRGYLSHEIDPADEYQRIWNEEANESYIKYKRSSMGGRARALKLNEERRREIAIIASKARWGK